jgi:hypothetical protein
MKAQFSPFILPAAGALLLFQSCYIADSFFVEEPPAPISVQKECERSIDKYVRSKSGNLTYTSYGFTQAEIHVPQEIVVLEEMEKNRAEGFLDGADTDSIILAKRSYIEENNIQRNAHVEHFYTLRNADESLTILETNFVLDDTFAVINFQPQILLTIPVTYELSLNYYMYEYTVFASEDVIEARRLSNRFYSFFKRRLEELKTIEEKSAFLFHALKATNYVLEKKKFDPEEFVKQLSTELIMQSPELSNSYLPLAFSPLYEKSYEGKITGYYIFHKFSQTKTDAREIKAIQIDLSPYYEIKSSSFLEAPFDSYFKE